MMLLRYTQESAQPFIYKGYALFISKLEILTIQQKNSKAFGTILQRQKHFCLLYPKISILFHAF